MDQNFEIILKNRPKADSSIEQYLMVPSDVIRQAERVGPYLRDRAVFFLGDDDHISPLLAADYGIMPLIYEVDGRIRASLRSSYDALGVKNYRIKAYDAHNPVDEAPDSDGFYLNPPYSRKSSGLGIKVWLTRTMEACKTPARGVLIMPWGGGNIDKPWVVNVQHSVSKFMSENNFRIVQVDQNVHTYEEVNDEGLMSSNIFLEWNGSKPLEHLTYDRIYN